jgi:hypothetical protein
MMPGTTTLKSGCPREMMLVCGFGDGRGMRREGQVERERGMAERREIRGKREGRKIDEEREREKGEKG